jgi:hypothetical protein
MRVKVRSLKMRPPRFTVGDAVVLVMDLEPPPFSQGLFELQCGTREREFYVRWDEVKL